MSNVGSYGLSRRHLTSFAGFSLLAGTFRQAFAQPGEQVIPWLDQPAAIPKGAIPIPQNLPPGFVWSVATAAPQPENVIHNLQRWEDLTTWITPNDKFFDIVHYGVPKIDAGSWSLELSGLVERPLTLSLDQVRALPRKEITCTIECSGNRGLPFFTSGIGNARWAGTPLASVLTQARPKKSGTEIIFVGSDAGDEIVRDQKIRSNFARSMSLPKATDDNVLLCYEMNGEPLPAVHGFPLRVIAPGWYGIASVKWLKRIEVQDTRFMGRFMARDYVTLREEMRKDGPFWAESSVGRWRLASAPARVVKQGNQYRVVGMAWGGPISKVEVQFDDGVWMPATLDTGQSAEFAWKFWTIDWKEPRAGEHTVASRAFDSQGNVQPTMNDPLLAGKRTYWESNGVAVRRVRIA